MSGIAPRVADLCDQLRAEGVSVGTAEMLDALSALQEVPWSDRDDFREALAATLAKSPDDRQVFNVVFDRWLFRSAEAEAVERELTSEDLGGGAGGGEGIDM